MVGLSLALGTFLAGLIISASDYGHETLARLLSLRDAFVALFFVTINVLIDPRVIVDNLSLLATIIGLIVAGKLLIWTSRQLARESVGRVRSFLCGHRPTSGHHSPVTSPTHYLPPWRCLPPRIAYEGSG